ncbi:MAG: 30S ribosomal protein S20 [Candidatus Acetothermia bacterium]
MIPTIQSSEKRMRQEKKRRKRNRNRKQALKRKINEIEDLIKNKEKKKAREKIPELMKFADRAAAKGPLHQNKADRIKSKMMRQINNLD